MESATNIKWPKKAVVTAGMPYGNKPLHFGHIGGVFVPADCYARFLRDRIGKQNVLFVCGTDCFGSPIDEGYRKKVKDDNYCGTIQDYVEENHNAQTKTLDSYNISLDIFEGSGIGASKDIHQQLTDSFIGALYKNGWLKRMSTLQFYDPQAQTFLNGRQVVGKCCPVWGCKAERAYADECDLGHQYSPEDLVGPQSTVTGTTPQLRPVENWYFDLPAFRAFLEEYVSQLENDSEVRTILTTAVREFLGAPVIYIKVELLDKYKAISDMLPNHTYRDAQMGKQSFELEFQNVEDRDIARTQLNKAGIRFRTGKALVPFRITGNIEWGVSAPKIEDVDGLTVWCWPESLWAPISFTVVALQNKSNDCWQDYWCAKDSCVYQFIGQDNLYFYSVVQPALFEAASCKDWSLNQTKVIANHHLLFGKKKASSSGQVKPPSADELLNYYTVEQLRAHFLALGLDQRSVSFSPKPFEQDENKRTDPRVVDPVLKEGALLTNVFNRLARSVFYEAAKNFDGAIPICDPGSDIATQSRDVLWKYDMLMHRAELHSVLTCTEEFIRFANKYWSERIASIQKASKDVEESVSRKQVLADSAYMLRIATLLMHPIAPVGCELIRKHFNFDVDEFFCWNGNLDSLAELCTQDEINRGFHPIIEIPARFDFFRKHESQYK